MGPGLRRGDVECFEALRWLRLQRADEAHVAPAKAGVQVRVEAKIKTSSQRQICGLRCRSMGSGRRRGDVECCEALRWVRLQLSEWLISFFATAQLQAWATPQPAASHANLSYLLFKCANLGRFSKLARLRARR